VSRRVGGRSEVSLVVEISVNRLGATKMVWRRLSEKRFWQYELR
jgi:hypothetical protein